MSSSVSRVEAACIDGRAQSPRYRQNQLSKLHAALVENAAEIRLAIRQESNHTSTEVEIQYALTLERVKELFDSIDLATFLEEEYRLAHSENAATREVAVGK